MTVCVCVRAIYHGPPLLGVVSLNLNFLGGKIQEFFVPHFVTFRTYIFDTTCLDITNKQKMAYVISFLCEVTWFIHFSLQRVCVCVCVEFDFVVEEEDALLCRSEWQIRSV